MAKRIGAAVKFPNRNGIGQKQELIDSIHRAIQAHHTERQTNALLGQIKSSGKSNKTMMWIAIISTLIALAACVTNIISTAKGSSGFNS